MNSSLVWCDYQGFVDSERWEFQENVKQKVMNPDQLTPLQDKISSTPFFYTVYLTYIKDVA